MELSERTELVEQSLVSCGIYAGVARVLARARAGEVLRTVFLGGSVTAGYLVGGAESFPALTAAAFRQLLSIEARQLCFVNSGMSGTGSLCGLMRLEQDVLCFSPDIVFLEFAVNDQKTPLDRRAFESLIRRLRAIETPPLLIVLLTTSKNGYSCAGQMKYISKQYALPVIDFGTTLLKAVRQGRCAWADYSSDLIHPNPQGHRFIAACIAHYLRTAFAATENESVWTNSEGEPERTASERMSERTAVEGVTERTDSERVTKRTAVEGVTKRTASERMSERTAVEGETERIDSERMSERTASDGMPAPEMSCKRSDVMRASIYERPLEPKVIRRAVALTTAQPEEELSFIGRGLLLSYPLQNSEGEEALLFVDQEEPRLLSAYSIGAWGQPCVQLVFEQETASLHHIVLRRVENGSALPFWIDAIGILP